MPELAPSSSYVRQGEKLAADALHRIEIAGRDSVKEPDLAVVIEDVFQIDVAVTDLTDGLDGCAWQTERERLIVLDKTPKWARQRFTLAHELGHILAGDAQRLIAEEVTVHHSAKISEKRANCFAACFLMPEGEMRSLGGDFADPDYFAQVTTHFRVSPISLAWRLHNLQLLARTKVDQWKNVTAESCAVRAGDPQLVGRELARSDAGRIPPRLLTNHLQRFYEGETSARPLAALLEIETDEVMRLLQTVEPS
ncbi:hypothetical protein CTI14_23085 [Methylobacterium radiotolerans]|nr:hypothetical protein CTI14_23085 [Methylobacterium radiotolerans]